MSIADFCAHLRSLRLDRANGRVKPYKPVLVLAVVVLIAKGKITDPRIFLDGGLRSTFYQLLSRIHGDAFPRADIRYPFRHLARDGVWRLVAREDAERDLLALLGAGGKAPEVMRLIACAELDAEVFAELAADARAREEAIGTLLSAYPEAFPAGTGEMVRGLLGEAGAGVFPVMPPPPERLSERALEEFLATCWSRSAFAALGVELASERVHGLPGRQVLTPVNAIDLLGFHPAARQWWVIELKRGRPSDAVVGQVSRYLGWLKAARASRGEDAVGAIVAGASDAKLEAAVRAHDGRLSLWRYDAGLELRRVV